MPKLVPSPRRSPIVTDVDDTGIVTAMRHKDQAGLAAAYDAYANPLYSYCVSQLRDEDRAGDVVHDTFIVAYERIGQLRDPNRLRPWLYAIARNECQRVFRERNRSAPLDEAMAVSDQTVEMDASLREAELRGLVQTAAGGLNPREREVIELVVQHDLAIDDVAATLGQSPNYVHALLSKARQQLEKSLSALIVARTGRESCGTLDGLLVGWDGTMTVLLRKRVARHIESCDICAERKRRDVNAMALLATTPILAAPLLLRSQVLSDATDIALVSANREIAERAGRLDGDGFPVANQVVKRSGGWALPVGATLIGAAILLGGAALMIGGPWGNLFSAGGATTPAIETSSPLITSPEVTPEVTAAPSPSPAAEPTPSEEVTPQVTPTEEPTSTPGPTVTFVPVPISALGIYCDRALTQPCSEVDLGSPNRAVVFLASNTRNVLDVAATSPGVLLIAPDAMQVAARPVQVSIESIGACGENVVTFTVAEPSQTEQLTVNAQPCVR